ncbi:MAG: minor capsid protein [Burkholderiaceae bacterium]|nr:minor capsid protein [Burkholderiaceae bacterium]
MSIAFNKAIEDEIQRMAQAQVNQMANHLSLGMIQRANQQNHAQATAAINNALGIDVSRFIQSSPSIKEEIDAAIIENANLIKSIQSEYLDKVRLAVSKNALDGKRPASVIAQIMEIGGVSESRAHLIARDQTNKLNGALTKSRQTTLGVEEYVWDTSGDERVREECDRNNGKTFRWDSPPPGGHPGQKIQCRCIAIPKFTSDE